MRTRSILRHIMTLVIAATPVVLQTGAANALPITKVGLVHPQLNLPDNGARLGIDMDGPYNWHGMLVIKVDGIYRQSPLFGILHVGDYIFSVNGFDLRTVNDVIAIVSSGKPGSASTVYFLDSQRAYTPMKITVNAASPSVFEQPGSTTQATAAPTNDSKPFCDEHPIMCVAGVVVGAWAIGKALSSSSGSPDTESTYTPNCQTIPVPDGNGNYVGETKEICN